MQAAAIAQLVRLVFQPGLATGEAAKADGLRCVDIRPRACKQTDIQQRFDAALWNGTAPATQRKALQVLGFETSSDAVKRRNGAQGRNRTFKAIFL